jgi:serine/threonine protein kinase
VVVALTLCLLATTGTPYTIAPEVFREEEYNEKTDVYSFSIGALGFAPLMCTTN